MESWESQLSCGTLGSAMEHVLPRCRRGEKIGTPLPLPARNCPHATARKFARKPTSEGSPASAPAPIHFK